MKYTFEKWIWEVVNKETHPFEYSYLTHSRAVESTVAHMLCQANDQRLPRLAKKRVLFSFHNGILDAETGFFHVYMDDGHLPPWIRSVADLPADKTTANFFDYTVNLEFFAPGFKLKDIPLVAWKKLLTDQEWSYYSQKRFKALLGRMLHDLDGDISKQQGCIWLTGVANSGKSMLIKNWQNVYQPEDVGVINDDVEKEFPDQHLKNSYFVVGPDVSDKLSIGETRFNCWIGGDKLVIKNKNHMATIMKWVAQFLFSSNTYPGILSKAGSGARRFFFFMFGVFITKVDTELDKKLAEELPLFLVACALQFLKFNKKYGKRGIWEKRGPSKKFGERKKEEENILPKMCFDGRREYTVKVSPLDAFLESDVCEYGPEYFCTLSLLKKHYSAFRLQKREGGLQTYQQGKTYNPEITPLTFVWPLQQRGCTWNTETNIITGLKLPDTQATLTSARNLSSHSNSHSNSHSSHSHTSAAVASSSSPSISSSCSSSPPISSSSPYFANSTSTSHLSNSIP